MEKQETAGQTVGMQEAAIQETAIQEMKLQTVEIDREPAAGQGKE